MAETPESKVKKKIRAILDAEGVYYVQPVTGGFGRNGPLDFGCSVPPFGRYLGIEAKSIYTKYGRKGATELQKEHIEAINKTGATTLVIDENNIHTLHEELKCLSRPC